jgi:hypothetical protein
MEGKKKIETVDNCFARILRGKERLNWVMQGFERLRSDKRSTF